MNLLRYRAERLMLKNLLPRFLSAVDALATASSPSLRARLALAVETALVFQVGDFPSDLQPRYEALLRLARSGKVPSYAVSDPRYVRTHPAFYLTAKQARSAANLLTGLLEAIALRLSHEPPDSTPVPGPVGIKRPKGRMAETRSVLRKGGE